MGKFKIIILVLISIFCFTNFAYANTMNESGNIVEDTFVTREEFLLNLIEFEDYINYAIKNKILQGNGSGLLNLENKITKEEAFVFLYRYALCDTSYSEYELKLENKEIYIYKRYKDYKNISLWAIDAVNWLTINGIIVGDEELNISPKEYIEKKELKELISRTKAILNSENNGTDLDVMADIGYITMHLNEGYNRLTMSKKTEADIKLKVTFTVNIPHNTIYVPVHFGAGEYNIWINGEYCKLNTSKIDNIYSYIYPHYLADFRDNINTVNLAISIKEKSSTTVEYIKNVFEYMRNNFIYDHDKAKENNSKGYRVVSNADELLAKKSGNCNDFSTFFAIMMKSVGIPCKINIGMAGKNLDIYHAWESVYIKDINAWINTDSTMYVVTGYPMFTNINETRYKKEYNTMKSL